MMTFTRSLLGAASIALAACAVPAVPAMHPATAASLTPPQPSDATVVFVRPPSSCDSPDYAVIVDENGRFVGNAGSNTTFSVTVPAGHHAFYAWPNVDLRTELHPEQDPVGAIELNASPGAVARVAVIIPVVRALICGRQAVYSLVAENGDGLGRAEMDSWIHEATAVEPEPIVGQRELQSDPQLVASHMESGRRSLLRQRQVVAESR